jgi:glutamate 5-kinase
MFISKYKNIVVKIGSNTLVNLIENNLFENFIEEIVTVKQFANITIVTSGAIATARKSMNFPKPIDISQKQALSSIGQVQLMHIYYQAFAKKAIKMGQILLTNEDINNPKSLKNLRATISSLRTLNAIPVINENDAISTDEIKIGDNDTLAAHVSCAINADLLVILTDVNGVYDSNPHINLQAKIITHTGIIKFDNTQIHSETEFGSGGIITKIKAGNIAIENGFHAIITNGRRSQPLTSIEEGYCTIFS